MLTFARSFPYSQFIEGTKLETSNRKVLDQIMLEAKSTGLLSCREFMVFGREETSRAAPPLAKIRQDRYQHQTRSLRDSMSALCNLGFRWTPESHLQTQGIQPSIRKVRASADNSSKLVESRPRSLNRVQASCIVSQPHRLSI